MSGKIADIVGERIDAWSLDVGRLLTGVGVGILSYVVPVYIADVTPKNLQGGFPNFHQFMVTFGTAITYVLGTVVSWRVLALIGTIPCLVHLVGLLMIPESPRWLAKIGRDKEFEATLQRLRGANSDMSQEANQIKIVMIILTMFLTDKSGRRPLLMAKIKQHYFQLMETSKQSSQYAFQLFNRFLHPEHA